MIKHIIIILFISLIGVELFAQKTAERDSLVSLISAKSMQIETIDTIVYRKVIGPAKFFHNNTYLLCDTALWNVNASEIIAYGRVRLQQKDTELTSDRLIYDINKDLAMFRGSVVELRDKSNNILRTSFLDYNTKDSIAVFSQGASMKDKDGQLIESLDGSYNSKTKIFNFDRDVQMFTDSIFIKTPHLEYFTDENIVDFIGDTHLWKDDKMLSSRKLVYDRNIERFLFTDNVHAQSPDKELYCDSLYYSRLSNNLEMFGNVQITDDEHNLHAFAHKMTYTDSSSVLSMTREPAMMYEMSSDNKKDSLWFSAERLTYISSPKYKIPEIQLTIGKSRKDLMNSDAVSAYRQNAALEARKQAEEKAKQNLDLQDKQMAKNLRNKSSQDSSKSTIDSEADSISSESTNSFMQDSSLYESPIQDSTHLSSVKDSLEKKIIDSTKINFFYASKAVKLFKSDLQMIADSMAFNDIDSLVRLYNNAKVWDNVDRQFSADSIIIESKGQNISKANLQSNSFIIIRQDSLYFNQIRSAEMMAYFDTTSLLKRFDALGDASSIFYLKEDSLYATINKSSAKMLSSTFTDGEIDHIYYFQQGENNVSPIAQIRESDKVLKGFDWTPQLRPRNRYDITKRPLLPSYRYKYSSILRPEFVRTNLYFPNYIDNLYLAIEHSKEAKALHKLRVERERARRDSIDRLKAIPVKQLDTLPKTDSVLVKKDSISNKVDSLYSKADSINVKSPKDTISTKRLGLWESFVAWRKARWARLDSLDAIKLKQKEEKRKAKLRENKRKILRDAVRQAKKDNALLNKYIDYYRERKRQLIKKAKLKDDPKK